MSNRAGNTINDQNLRENGKLYILLNFEHPKLSSMYYDTISVSFHKLSKTHSLEQQPRTGLTKKKLICFNQKEAFICHLLVMQFKKARAWQKLQRIISS